MSAAPDLLWLVAALIIGFILGFLPAILLVKNRINAARVAGRHELATDLAILEERLARREEQLQQQYVELQAMGSKL